MDDDVKLAISRFQALTNGVKPRGRRRPGREITGAARWVRCLYEHLERLTAAEWTYEQIAQSLNEAAIPLNGGVTWDEGTVRTAMARERWRRRQGDRPEAAKEAAEPQVTAAISRSGQTDMAGVTHPPQLPREDSLKQRPPESATSSTVSFDAPAQPQRRLDFRARTGPKSGLLHKNEG